MGRIIPSILWKIKFMFQTTNQPILELRNCLPNSAVRASAIRPPMLAADRVLWRPQRPWWRVFTVRMATAEVMGEPCYFRNFHCKASILGCPRLWKSLNDHLPHGKPWEDGSKPWEMGLSQNWLHHFFHRFLIISPMNWCHFGVYRIPQFFRKSRHGGPILPRFWKYSKT